MVKNLNENWHISTILKKVCSVFQHHSGLLNAICSFVRNNTCVRMIGQQFKQLVKVMGYRFYYLFNITRK